MLEEKLIGVSKQISNAYKVTNLEAVGPVDIGNEDERFPLDQLQLENEVADQPLVVLCAPARR